MRHFATLGIIGLVLGIVGGLFGAATWFAAGSLVFGVTMISAYGYALFNSEASEAVAPYEIGEASPEVAPAQAEEELRRKDRGTVPTSKMEDLR